LIQLHRRQQSQEVFDHLVQDQSPLISRQHRPLRLYVNHLHRRQPQLNIQLREFSGQASHLAEQLV
jgi:hypothetical protein